MNRTMKYWVIGLAMSLQGFAYIVKPQPYTSAVIENLLKGYCTNSPWDEIFIHTDRSDFIAGEDIWMSIYNIDRGTGQLTGRNRIVYIELLNPSNIPVIQMRLKLENGISCGNIFLPDTLSPGTYTIRGYTNWMKNFLPENCFMHDIKIYNPFKNTGFKRKIYTGGSVSSDYDMKFFPEGGKMVNGVMNRMVVRFTSLYGKGLMTRVVVKDNSGNEIVSFSTGEYGYGTFMLTPEKGRSYFAEANGLKFNLPEAKDEGISLIIDNSEAQSIQVTINAAGPYSSKAAGTYHILVHSGGKVFYKTEIPTAGITTKIIVPRNLLAGGVNQISVFGNEFLPLAERLIFNPVSNEKNISIFSEPEYGRREKVSAKLNSGVLNDHPASVSVTVIPAGIAGEQPDIREYMIFGSEFGITPWQNGITPLKSLSRELVDNFLISASSRWIIWEDVLSDRPFERPYPVEKEGHYLTGILKNRENGQPDTSALLYLSIPGKFAEFKYARTNRNGRFSFLLPADDITRKIIIQPADGNSNSVLEIEPSFPWKAPESVCFTDSIPQNKINIISKLSFNYQTSRIYVTKFKQEPAAVTAEGFPGKRFYGIPETEVRLDDYIKLPVMQEVFFELVPGVRFRERRSGYEISVLNPSTNMFYNEPPLTMIDGVVIKDLSLVANLDPEKVEQIEVVKTPYMIGNLFLYGIVNIITRSGNFSNITLPDYAVQLRYRAVERSSSFLSPDYTDQQKKAGRIPDLRNTLYWNPLITPDKNGEYKIEFWTHDQSGEYLIFVNGVAQSGKPFSSTCSFKIR